MKHRWLQSSILQLSDGFVKTSLICIKDLEGCLSRKKYIINKNIITLIKYIFLKINLLNNLVNTIKEKWHQ
jgi:hypothetical protein